MASKVNNTFAINGCCIITSCSYRAYGVLDTPSRYIAMGSTQNDKTAAIYSVGILHGRPMERLEYRYDGHEEITGYIRMRHVYYHPMVMRVFCLPLKFSARFVIPDAIKYNLILNMCYKICILISSP